MALPKLPLPTISRVLVWRLVLGGMVLLGLIFGVMLWMSGEWETHDAMNEGRRLIIRLDDNSIEGKQITLDKPAAAVAPAPQPVASAVPPPVNLGDTAPVAASAVPMAPVNPALEQQSAAGMLPIIGTGGTLPWHYYARPYDRKGILPMIAIIISGLGESKEVTESAIKLSPYITLSFTPYAHGVDSWVTAARASGHEVMIDLPLELSTYPASDPGPYGLIASHDPQENAQHLQWLMSRFPGYIGFLMPQNEAYSSNDTAFKALLDDIGKHGLMVAVGHEPAKDETKQLLGDSKTATIVADELVDEELTPAAIQSHLLMLEQVAKSRGYAIGVAQAYPITMQQLALWSSRLASDGYVLAPVSFITKLKAS